MTQTIRGYATRQLFNGSTGVNLVAAAPTKLWLGVSFAYFDSVVASNPMIGISNITFQLRFTSTGLVALTADTVGAHAGVTVDTLPAIGVATIRDVFILMDKTAGTDGTVYIYLDGALFTSYPMNAGSSIQTNSNVSLQVYGTATEGEDLVYFGYGWGHGELPTLTQMANYNARTETPADWGLNAANNRFWIPTGSGYVDTISPILGSTNMVHANPVVGVTDGSNAAVSPFLTPNTTTPILSGIYITPVKKTELTWGGTSTVDDGTAYCVMAPAAYITGITTGQIAAGETNDSGVPPDFADSSLVVDYDFGATVTGLTLTPGDYLMATFHDSPSQGPSPIDVRSVRVPLIGVAMPVIKDGQQSDALVADATGVSLVVRESAAGALLASFGDATIVGGAMEYYSEAFGDISDVVYGSCNWLQGSDYYFVEDPALVVQDLFSE